MRRIALLLAMAAPLAAQAEEAGKIVRFITCPVYRDADSGRKSGCWLADDHATGTRWDVSQSPYKPDWNFAVLVEGKPAAEGGNSDAGSPCGGKVLDPVRTSILAEPCTRHVLPAEGFSGRRFVLPRRNNNPVGVARPEPQGLYGDQVFPVYFEFDRNFIVYQYSDWLIDRAVTWVQVARPKKLIVTGFAATDPIVVSGRSLTERPQVAQERADMVAETLRRLLPGMSVETHAEVAAKPTQEPEADGLPGQSQRRAEIRAIF